MQSTEQSSSTKNASIEAKIDNLDNKLTNHSLEWEMLKEQKRTINRLFVLTFVLIFLWFATVVGFGLYLNQFDFEDETVQTIEAEQQGDNNIVQGGDVNYGVSEG